MCLTLKKILQSSPWASNFIVEMPSFHKDARAKQASLMVDSEISKQEGDIFSIFEPNL